MPGYGSVWCSAELHVTWWGAQCVAWDPIHTRNSSVRVCSVRVVGNWFQKKQMQLCVQVATVLNKLLAEVSEMPGVFWEDLDSKFHKVPKITEADTQTEELFFSAVYWIGCGLYSCKYFGKNMIPSTTQNTSVRLCDWENEKVFQQRWLLHKEIFNTKISVAVGVVKAGRRASMVIGRSW